MKISEAAKLYLPGPWVTNLRRSRDAFDALRDLTAMCMLNGKAPSPRRATYEITYRCNLQCVMCPLTETRAHTDGDTPPGELGARASLELVDELATQGVKTLTITGGEPLLRRDLLSVIHRAKQRGLRCVLLSNGTLISDAVAVELVAAGLDLLYLSVDGPREAHDRIRGREGAFEKTMAAAAYVRAERRRPGRSLPLVVFSCTISAGNQGSLTGLVELAREYDAALDFSYLFFTTEQMMTRTGGLVSVGDAKAEDQRLPDALRQVDSHALQGELAEVKQLSKQHGVRIHFQPDLALEDVGRWYEDEAFSFVNRCLYPWRSVRINPGGTVYPCSIGQRMGRVGEQGLDSIWNGHRYIHFRRQLRQAGIFPRCTKCCKLSNRFWHRRQPPA